MDRDDGWDDGFGGLVRDAGPGLLRTAVLLTGDRQAGEDLVVDVLARARGRWRAPRAADDPLPGLRQVLVERHLGRRLGGGQVVESPTSADGPTAALREALLHLDPTERTVLVLRRLDGLPEEEVARLLRRPAAAVRDDLARAEAALPSGGQAGGEACRQADGEDVGRDLAALADDLTWPDPTVPPEAVADLRRRRRRTRAGGAVAAAALAGVLWAGVPAAATWLGPAPAERSAAAPTTVGTQPADTVWAEEARQAVRPRLEAAAAVLGAPLVLTAPAEWDRWLPRGRPAEGATGPEDADTCPPLADRLTEDLGVPMAYWTGALPRGPMGCTWVPEPVPLSQAGPHDHGQVVSVGFVAVGSDADGSAVEELRTSLLPGAGRGEAPCPSVDVPGGGALISCDGPTGGSYGTPLVLAVPDARGAGVWVLSATVQWGAQRSTTEVLSVLVEAVRPAYG